MVLEVVSASFQRMAMQMWMLEALLVFLLSNQAFRGQQQHTEDLEKRDQHQTFVKIIAIVQLLCSGETFTTFAVSKGLK